MEDNWLIIKTDLETKSFEQKLKQVKSELEQLEKKQKVLQKYNIFNDKVRENNPQAVIEWTKENEKELEKYDLTLTDIGNKDTWTKLSAQIEALSNKYIDLTAKQSALSNVTDNIEDVIDKTEEIEKNTKIINDNINNVGRGLESTIKKVGKWALAVFGIRSAYNFVRKSVSSVSQYNEQIGADINYMSMALASVMEPVVRRIVDLAHTLLVYIGYIVKAWTGKDIFKNANKYLQKSVGSAKQLRKELAGFDEMNVLSDSSSGGGTGVTLPSFDLSKPEDVPIPKWLEWIKDNKKIVLETLGVIATYLTLIKLGIKNIKALGIVLLLDGVIEGLKEIKKFLKDPSFENFINVVIRIGEAVLGLGLIFRNLPLIVAGAVALIVALIIKNYDKIVGLFDKAIEWLNTSFREKMVQVFGPIGNIITDAISSAVKIAKSLFEDLFGGIKKIVDGIVKIFKGDFKGGISQVFSGLKSIMLAPVNALISGINTLIKGINKIKIKAPSWLPLVGGKEVGFNIPPIPRLAKGGIINMPGRGVNYNGANIAEKAPEGIIPLTDSQQMEWLGQAIGKYITINATIPISMNGRVLSRELQRIQNEESFGFNR